MIAQLQKIESTLAILQEIPNTFFSKLEAAHVFDDNLFPDWSNGIFSDTDLKKKFNAVYTKYKALPDKNQRDQIILAFINTNRISDLCSNNPAVTSIAITALPESIQTEIEVLFNYLYTSALDYHKFEKHSKDTIQKAIDRFIANTGMDVCPFCGLEGYLNLKGQARLALDHWLCKDIFPFAAVNFDNLIPIGDKCNSRPAKGTTNVLFDDDGNRISAYYPFAQNDGVNAVFSFISEPKIHGINDEDWACTLTPVNAANNDYFSSWTKVFNIFDRYHDYFIKYIFLNWESEYSEFIKDSGINHANTIDEFKQKLNIWRAGAFPIKKRAGAILYRAFINYLISHASNAYLYSLCENFKSQANA